MSAFFKAAQSGDVKRIKQIINQKDFNPKASILPLNNEYGFYPPLVATIALGNEISRLLIEKGANVNDAVGCNGMTPLYLAAQEGFEDLAKLLIANGANVDTVTSDDGVSALHIAVQFGHTKVVKLLIHSNANLNSIKKDDGNTPLMVALQSLRTDIAKMLIQAGANVSIYNAKGISPLMLASNRGLDELVITLLNAGEDPLYEDPTFGCSAIDYASLANRKSVIEILSQKVKENREKSAAMSSIESSANVDNKPEVMSLTKQLAKMNVNLYETPLQPHETSDTETFGKETKHKICDNPDCVQPNRAFGLPLMKCTKCRCVRYCGRDCQTAHWTVHKKMCKKLTI